MDEVSIEQARPRLGDLVRDAQQHGITTLITRNGKPAAVLVPAEATQPNRRNPADVTAHRLLEHTTRYKGRFEGRELDAIGDVRYALQRIAEEDEQAK